jgi:PilZ domain
MSSDERRVHERFKTRLPATIAGEAVELQLAIGHDMSQKGARIVTREELTVGAEVAVTLCIPPDGGPERTLTGHVVRSSTNVADPEGLWPFQAAIEFDEAVPELEALLEETRQRLEQET